MNKLVVVSNNVRSAYNIGAIFRTLDGLGNIAEFYICGISPTPENPKVLKTSLGAEQNVPWKYFATLPEALHDLDQRRIPVYVLEQTSSSMSYVDMKYPDQVAIIVGHELEGVQLEHLVSRPKLDIPMFGSKESLNVEVATAIVSYFIAYKWGLFSKK